MKKWKKNTLWALFFLSVIIIMSFAKKAQQEHIVGMPIVDIKLYKDMLFLPEETILERLSNKHLIGHQKKYSEVDLNKIEEVLQAMPEVRDVDVYACLSGSWNIDITLRQPIARLFNQDGSSVYLDKDGKLMPLSPNYTAHVITVSGFINEHDFEKSVNEIMNNDSLKTIEILDDLYAISSYVCSDEFLSAQFTHVYINRFKEFELIPRVGDQRILFGTAEDVAGKFKKLELFYQEGMSRAGWERFDTINVMYKSQVSCS
jgi:cell division protein FtsQ